MRGKLLLMSILVAMGWWVVSGYINQEMMVVCDVGQGNGILLKSGNNQVVVDTGADNGKMTECLEKYLPFGDKKIEAVIISHDDSDHSGGLKKISTYYEIEQVYYSDRLRKNDIIRFGSYQIEVLWPEEIRGNDNGDSIVVKVDYRGKKMLLMGDVTAEVEQEMVWRNMIKMEVEVLVVGHHGSKSSTSLELLETVKPKEAVISVGKNNRYGHPGQEVITRLNDWGIKIRRTDEEGDIIYRW